MDRRIRRTRSGAAALLLVSAALLAGCGAEETGTPTADAATQEPSASGPSEAAETPVADAQPAALPRKPFCDQVDESVVTAALGQKARAHTFRKPGDTYEIFGSKQTESRYYCLWQTNPDGAAATDEDAVLVIAINGEALTSKKANSLYAETAASEKKNPVTDCQEADSLYATEVARTTICNRKGDQFNQPASTASASGLFGDTMLTCSVIRGGKNQEDATRTALDEACGQVPSMIGS